MKGFRAWVHNLRQVSEKMGWLKKRRLWALGGVLLVGGLLGLALAVGVISWQRAQSLERDAEGLRAAVSIGAILEEPEETERLRARLGSLERGLGGLGVTRLGQRFGWLPLVGDDLRATHVLVEAARWDLAAAGDLLNGGDSLAAWYREGGASPFWEGIALPSAEARRYAKASLLLASQKASRAQALLQSVEPQGLSGFLAPRWRSLTEVTTEIQATVEWGRRTVTLLDALAAVQGTGDQLRSSLVVGEGEGAEWSLDTALVELEALAVALGKARQGAQEAWRALPPGEDLGQVEALLLQLQDLLTATQQTARAGLSALWALEPALRAMEEIQYAPLSGGGLLLTALRAVQGNPQGLEKAIDLVEEARETALQAARDVPAAQEDLERLSELLQQLEEALRLAQALPVALLGDQGAVTYLVLGQTADELRATGGFVSALWEVTLRNGILEDVRYFDTVAVDDWGNLISYPLPPTPLRYHMNAGVWLLRDVSWEPDFPTVAQLAEDMYWLGQRREVDGVIAINQWTMQRLVNALGQVPSPVTGEAVPAEHFMTYFEQEKTVHGRAYIDVALREVLEVLGQSSSPATLRRLATAVLQALRGKELMLYLDDPDLQGRVEELGWAGQLATGPGDALLVVDSNVGWSKVDRNIQREVEYQVTLSEHASPQASLTLRYVNHSGPQASGCQQQWMNRGSTYEEMKHACYWNFLRVYVPQGARLLSATSLPLPPGAVAGILGFIQEGGETLAMAARQGRSVFSGLVTVGAGEEREIRLVYELPPSVVENQGGVLTYRLHLQKQPGVPVRGVRVRLQPPPGYTLAESSLPTSPEGEGIAVDLGLTQDTTLVVRFNAQAG